MKTNKILLLATIVLPIAVTAFACAHRAEDEGTRRLNDLVVLANDNDRGYLGVIVDEVTAKLARRKNLKVQEGVYVSDVAADSPAEEAGFKEGDVILEYDGKKVFDNNDLVSEVRKTKPGTDVQIAINRAGEKKNLKVTIGTLPRERTYSFNMPPAPRMRIAPRISMTHASMVYGLTLEELNRQLGEYFGAPNGRGLLVKNVKRGSEADKSGFKAGDVIAKIGKENVDDVSDMWDVLREYKDGEKAEFEVLRKGKTEKLTLTVDEDNQRDLSFRWHDGDDDVIFDLLPHEEGFHFRHEADKLKHETNRLKRELERMRDNIQDEAIHLKEKLQRELRKIRENVNV